MGLNANNSSPEELIASGQKFDLIFKQHVLEHFEDPFQILRDCNTLLNKDGIIVILVFFTINSLLTEPIISMAIIEDKLNNERGKAFLAAIKLLENSNWLGAYGLGFIEQYFSVYTDRIIGLGAGSGMIFNSYLDIWISAGILGLVYHFTLLGMSFSRSHLYTLIIPVYWFIAANTNPVIIDEYYYLFLGISYGLLLKEKKGKY